MWNRILHRTELTRLIDELAQTRRVIGPVQSDGRYLYAEVESAESVHLDFNYCVYSPKSYLFPPREPIFTYNVEHARFETRAVLDDRPLAIVGVHPCDVHAVRLLDHVFSAEPSDEHYLVKRRSTVFIGVDCPAPCTEGVFCRDMNTHEADSGFDLMCDPLSALSPGHQEYGVRFGSDLGRELVLRLRVGRNPDASDSARFATYRTQKEARFPRRLPADAEALPGLLDRSYDSLLWEATARRCYSCGSCNLVCPTCYCFDLHDEPDLGARTGRRIREWDACQLYGFAEVAGGHNFRSTAAARLRHRVYRKGKWIRDHTGLPGCVGCARCDRACTAKISLAEVFTQLAEEV